MISPVGWRNNRATEGIGESSELGPLKSGWTEAIWSRALPCPVQHNSLHHSCCCWVSHWENLPTQCCCCFHPCSPQYSWFIGAIFHPSEQGSASPRSERALGCVAALAGAQLAPADPRWPSAFCYCNKHPNCSCLHVQNPTRSPHLQNLLLPRQWGSFHGQGLLQREWFGWKGTARLSSFTSCHEHSTILGGSKADPSWPQTLPFGFLAFLGNKIKDDSNTRRSQAQKVLVAKWCFGEEHLLDSIN